MLEIILENDVGVIAARQAETGEGAMLEARALLAEACALHPGDRIVVRQIAEAAAEYAK